MRVFISFTCHNPAYLMRTQLALLLRSRGLVVAPTADEVSALRRRLRSALAESAGGLPRYRCCAQVDREGVLTSAEQLICSGPRFDLVDGQHRLAALTQVIANLPGTSRRHGDLDASSS